MIIVTYFILFFIFIFRKGECIIEKKMKKVALKDEEKGFEYDEDVTDDIGLCKRIIERNCFFPKDEFLYDSNDQFTRLIV